MHEWEYFDEQSGSWNTMSRIAFPVTGGREDGYCAYSAKNMVAPGRWRVLVKTEDGAVLGRQNFTVVNVDTPPSLKEYQL